MQEVTKEKLKEKLRIVNFRPMFFGAVLLCASVLCTVLILYSLWYLFLVAAILCGVALICVFTKKFKRLIFFVTIYCAGFLITFLSIYFYNDNSVNGNEYIITARVSYTEEYTQTYAVTLTNVVLVDSENNIKKLSGKTVIKIYDNIGDIGAGDKIYFTGKLTAVEMDAFNLLKRRAGFDYNNNIRYTGSVNFSDLDVIDGSPNIAESIQMSVKETLIEQMGVSSGSTVYSVLFGERSVIDEHLYEQFRKTGTSHLLAVSGMHIVVIMGLLLFLFKKLRLNKITSFILMFAALAFYCYLCGFIPSAIRSAIMGLVFMLAGVLGKRNDSLSSLGFACIIILLFKPLYLFDVGFQLSFMSVLGIIFSLRFSRLLNIKNKYFKGIVDICVITVFISVITMPIVTGTFGVFPIYTILANVLTITIFNVAFAILLMFILLAIPIKAIAGILVVPQSLFEFVFYINELIASLPFAAVKVVGFGLLASMVLFLALFVSSNFVMIKIRAKTLVCMGLICAFSILAVFANIPVYNSQNVLNFNNKEAGYELIIATGNYYYLVNPDVMHIANVKSTLNDLRLNSLDGIIFTSLDNFEPARIKQFIKDYGNPVIYVQDGHAAVSNMRQMGFSVSTFTNAYGGFGKIGIRTYCTTYQGHDTYVATMITINADNILFVKKNLSVYQKAHIREVIEFDIKYLYLQGETTNILPDFDAQYVLYGIQSAMVYRL